MLSTSASTSLKFFVIVVFLPRSVDRLFVLGCISTSRSFPFGSEGSVRTWIGNHPPENYRFASFGPRGSYLCGREAVMRPRMRPVAPWQGLVCSPPRGAERSKGGQGVVHVPGALTALYVRNAVIVRATPPFGEGVRSRH